MRIKDALFSSMCGVLVFLLMFAPIYIAHRNDLKRHARLQAILADSAPTIIEPYYTPH